MMHAYAHTFCILSLSLCALFHVSCGNNPRSNSAGSRLRAAFHCQPRLYIQTENIFHVRVCICTYIHTSCIYIYTYIYNRLRATFHCPPRLYIQTENMFNVRVYTCICMHAYIHAYIHTQTLFATTVLEQRFIILIVTYKLNIFNVRVYIFIYMHTYMHIRTLCL